MTQEALSIELPVRPESARRAREAVTAFRGQLDEPTYNDLRLVVSEFVADVARAEADGGHDVGVRIELRDDRIRASAIEGAGAYELKSWRPQLGEPGWGTYLAHVLGRRCGSRHDAERGSIWVEMELSDCGSSRSAPSAASTSSSARMRASSGLSLTRQGLESIPLAAASRTIPGLAMTSAIPSMRSRLGDRVDTREKQKRSHSAEGW